MATAYLICLNATSSRAIYRRGFNIIRRLELRIAGNYIGLDVSGTTPIGNAFSGIYLTANARSLRIGTNGDGSGDTAERNVISGNGSSGLSIDSPETGLVIAGNYIGVNAAGTAAIGNTHAGVWASGTNGLVVGTNGNGIGDAVEGNLISGNGWDGVRFVNASVNGIAAGNLIETNAAGLSVIRNSLAGVAIYDDCANIRIGTNADGVSDANERNVISGNSNEGVWMRGVNTTGVVVAGNFIGVDINGTAGLVMVEPELTSTQEPRTPELEPMGWSAGCGRKKHHLRQRQRWRFDPRCRHQWDRNRRQLHRYRRVRHDCFWELFHRCLRTEWINQ